MNQGESGGGGGGSVDSGVAGVAGNVVGVEEVVLFDTGAMFDLSNERVLVLRAHRDTVNLMAVEEEGVCDVFDIIWNARDSRCGASVGSREKLNSGIAQSLNQVGGSIVDPMSCNYMIRSSVRLRTSWILCAITIV